MRTDTLFVAGVGQVLLEAGAAGFPCLLASDKGAEYSTFLTRHNVRENYGRNLTLAHPAERHTNVRVSDIEFGQLDDYDISDAIRENFSFSKRLEEYLNYINSSVSPVYALRNGKCFLPTSIPYHTHIRRKHVN